MDIHSTDNHSSQDEDLDSVTDLTVSDRDNQTQEENNESNEELTSTGTEASSFTVERATKPTREKRNFHGFSKDEIMSKKQKRS